VPELLRPRLPPEASPPDTIAGDWPSYNRPYMVPYSITVADAAAADASLGFIFYGGVIVLPVIFL
jgi:hypothetical protein